MSHVVAVAPFPFKKYWKFLADLAFQEVFLCGFRRFLGTFHAAGFFGSAALVGELCGTGAGSGGIAEHVHGGEAHAFRKRQRGLKVHFALGGKAHHEIRGNGTVGEVPPDPPADLRVFRTVVFPVHGMQCLVTAALQGQVELGAELGQGCQSGKLFLGQPFRFERTQPDTLHAGGAGTALHGFCQRAAPLHAVEAQIDAAEDDLPIAVFRKGSGSGGNVFQRKAPAASPCVGNDAVAAKAVAPVLDLQERTGVVRHGVTGEHLEIVLSGIAVHGGDAGVVLAQLGEQCRQTAAVLGADNQIGFGDRRGLFRIRLRIAAGEHQQSIGVFPPDFSHGVV